MKTTALALAAVLGGAAAQLPVNFCKTNPSWTICNTSAPIDARAADIVARLSLADKILALNSDTHALPRCGCV